jgi:hypothetical protein
VIIRRSLLGSHGDVRLSVWWFGDGVSCFRVGAPVPQPGRPTRPGGARPDHRARGPEKLRRLRPVRLLGASVASGHRSMNAYTTGPDADRTARK